MDRPVFERLPAAPAPKALAPGLRRWEMRDQIICLKSGYDIQQL